MRHMVLAMLVFALALGAGTALDLAGVERTLLLTALVGGAGALAGAVVLELLLQASRGRS